jgi:hypothetical protein
LSEEGDVDDDLTRDQQADEALLAHLRALAAAADPVPEEALLAARSAFAYLRMDAELAELTYDSAVDEDQLVGVRSATGTTRQLTFQAGVAQLEIEISPAGTERRLVGQCLPATAVDVTVRQPAVQRATTTDDLGRFVLEVTPGPVSLRCSWPHAAQVIETAWVVV